MKYSLVLSFMFIVLSSYGQHGQFICQDVLKSKNILSYEQVQNTLSQRSMSSTFTVNVIAYILRDDNGGLGPSTEDVMAELELMQAHFAPSDICFSFLGIGEIWNSEYIVNWVDDHRDIAEEIIADFGSPTRMDIIFVPDEVADFAGGADFGGGSFFIPNHYFAIQESFMGLYATSHEMGHCLDLLHTHNGYDAYNDTVITDICHVDLERVNGSNGQTAGDQCPDTPADPVLWFAQDQNPFGCYPIGPDVDCNLDTFNASITNIMSYARHCQYEFTPDQINRMHAELMTGSVGPLLRAPDNVVLPAVSLTSGIHLVTSGTYINNTANAIYYISGTAFVRHVASTTITLRPGFRAYSVTGSGYEAYINPLCN